MIELKKILYLLDYQEKKNFFLVLILMLLMALFDTLGVASILPFISLLSNPSLIDTNEIINFIFNISKNFGINDAKQFLYFFGIIVFFLLIVSLIIRAVTIYYQFNFTLMLDYSISKRLIESYLCQSYSWFLNKNSSDLGKNILSEVYLVIQGTMVPLMSLISQSLVALALLMMLFIIDPILTITSGMILTSGYLVIFFLMKNILNQMGDDRLNANENRFKAVSEAFGSIKETKFLHLEKKYVDQYSKHGKIYAKNSAFATVIGQVPRNFIEGIAFGGMIAIVLFLMSGGKGFEDIIPLIALYTFAGYRLMPAFQQIYNSLTTLKFSQASLNSLYSDVITLKKTRELLVNAAEFKFSKSIVLNNVSYSYPNKKNLILKNISLYIQTKSKVGIVGKTGSGKTTVLDIILGLLNPSKGNLLVDGKIIDNSNVRSWQKIIGYVPQQIYLRDRSIAENIAFGKDEKDIDYQLLYNVAEKANIHEFVMKELDQGYKTLVGERGIRLSGGQRQRLGIARALYTNPQVIIFDEATNSLDNLTEKYVMDAVDKLSNKIAVIIVAHRLSTVKNCDQIFLFDKGEIVKSGKFNELNLL